MVERSLFINNFLYVPLKVRVSKHDDYDKDDDDIILRLCGNVLDSYA
jgi:hypothetical protein